MHSRVWIAAIIVLTVEYFSGIAWAQRPSVPAKAPEKIIIDTDIGGDIDDAFAVALALQSPELEILGITTASGNTAARAKILDRMLGVANRQDIPVAVGIPTAVFVGPFIEGQLRFGEKSPFARPTHPPAVDFILDQIHRYPGQITLVAIGPLTNIGALLDKSPQEFRHLKRIVMMGAWIGPFVDAGSTVKPGPETNIVIDISAAKKVFQSGVPLYVVPTDATWNLKLDEVKRRSLWAKGAPLTDSLALLYVLWADGLTPVLWDAMAVGYVIQPDLCPVEPMHIVVDDKGNTIADSAVPNAMVCLHSDTDAFFRFYMARLLAQ
jgi:purine nucleosidase